MALVAWGLTAAAPGPDPLAGDLRRLDRGRVVAAPVAPEVRAVAIYYGASWCGPCRAFVPELIAAYPRLRASGVEVLFVSDDPTCAAALDYARTSRMPFLLLPCDAERRRRLRRLGGRALPGIVLADRDGRMIATSWSADGSSRPRRLVDAIVAHATTGQAAGSSPAAPSLRRSPAPRPWSRASRPASPTG